jgi:hypothetical protein
VNLNLLQVAGREGAGPGTGGGAWAGGLKAAKLELRRITSFPSWSLGTRCKKLTFTRTYFVKMVNIRDNLPTIIPIFHRIYFL